MFRVCTVARHRNISKITKTNKAIFTLSAFQDVATKHKLAYLNMTSLKCLYYSDVFKALFICDISCSRQVVKFANAFFLDCRIAKDISAFK